MTNGQKHQTFNKGDKVRITAKTPTPTLLRNLKNLGIDKDSILVVELRTDYPFIRLEGVHDGYHFSNFSKAIELDEDLFKI